MVEPAHPLALAGYQLHLPSFEGPIDVLLRLIEREQLAIADVSLMAVTDQFLAHLAAMGGAPATEIARFSTVAAQLLVLKSRALLPRPQIAESDEGEDELVDQLRDYQALKQARIELAARDRAGDRLFPRGAMVLSAFEARPPRLVPGPPTSLVQALRRRLTLLTPHPIAQPVRRLVSLPNTISRVMAMLSARSRVGFADVVGSQPGREQVLVAFLAVLVLLRRKQIDVDQLELFGPFDLILLDEAPDCLPSTETGFA